jgi:hypothetical protein
MDLLKNYESHQDKRILIKRNKRVNQIPSATNIKHSAEDDDGFRLKINKRASIKNKGL